MESRGKRGAKPRNSYSPDAYNFQHLRDFDEEEEAKKKARNEAIRSRNIALKGSYNKWTTYKTTIGKLASSIARDMHYIEVYRNENRDGHYGGGSEAEIAKCEQRIKTAKESILATFQQIENENKNDKIWVELSMADANGNVDVRGVLCSVCNKEDSEGNDILFCDHAGCYRAYHQQCLDPPIDLKNIKEDEPWFCWNCECKDECLYLVGELTGCERENWRDLFPELKAVALGSAAKLLKDIEEESSSESEDDEDYVPGYLRKQEKAEGQEGNGGAAHAGGDDDDDSNPGSDTVSSGEDEEEEEEEEQEKEGSEEAAQEGNDAAKEGVDGEEDNADDDSDYSISDSLEDVDDEEIGGLLDDANIQPEEVEALKVQPRQLRQRGTILYSNNIVPDVVEGGEADVNKKVGRVHRGVIITGTVTQFIPLSSHVLPPGDIPDDMFIETEDTWKVKYDDDSEFIYGKKELK